MSLSKKPLVLVALGAGLAASTSQAQVADLLNLPEPPASAPPRVPSGNYRPQPLPYHPPRPIPDQIKDVFKNLPKPSIIPPMLPYTPPRGTQQTFPTPMPRTFTGPSSPLPPMPNFPFPRGIQTPFNPSYKYRGW